MPSEARDGLHEGIPAPRMPCVVPSSLLPSALAQNAARTRDAARVFQGEPIKNKRIGKTAQRGVKNHQAASWQAKASPPFCARARSNRLLKGGGASERSAQLPLSLGRAVNEESCTQSCFHPQHLTALSTPRGEPSAAPPCSAGFARRAGAADQWALWLWLALPPCALYDPVVL